MNKLSLVCLIGTAILLQSVEAQTYYPNKGKLFWCAFPENKSGACTQGFRIYANNSTSGTVEAQGISIPFSVTGGGSTEVFLPSCQVNIGSGNIAATGIEINGLDSIRVEAFFYQNNSSESAVLAPLHLLAFDYLASMYVGQGADQLAELVVLALHDDTSVDITPAADAIGGFAAGLSFTKVLQKGETFQLQSLGDLTGTRVICTNAKQIAVFQGNISAQVGGCPGAVGHYLFEQTLAMPSPGVGRHFCCVPFKEQAENYVKITAFEDSTRFGFLCNFDSMVLNRGESLIKLLDSATLISSNKPLAVTQFGTNLACHPAEPGDAAMIQLFSANFQSNRMMFTTPSLLDSVSGQPFFQHFFVNLVAQGQDTSEIWVDSVDVGNMFIPFTNGPNLWAAQVEVQPGDHMAWSDDQRFFQATTYGYGPQDAYAHALGFDYFLQECIGGGVCQPAKTTVCVGDTLDFSHCGEGDLTGCLWHIGDKDTSSLPMPVYVFMEPGSYDVYFEGKTPNGCEFFSTSITITVETCCDTTWSPNIFFDDEPCLDSTLIFTVFADSLPDSLIWVINGMDTVIGPALFWAFENGGPATVELLSAFNDYCILADTLSLDIGVCHPSVQTENCLHIPNAFSPNGDALNDRFLPVSQCGVTDYSMKIFNRWGDCVFETNDPYKGWDGGGQSSDVYIYSVQYLENEGSKIVKKGDLTLLR